MATKHIYYVNNKSFSLLQDALHEWRGSGREKMYRSEQRTLRIGGRAWKGVYTEEYHPSRGWHNGHFVADEESVRENGPCPR